MATLTISVSGSAIVNGSKSYTVSDTDLQALLDWAAAAYAVQIQQAFDPNYGKPGDVPITPTRQQVLLTWVQSWINGTKVAVQRFKTPAPVAPPPISIS